MFGEREGAHLQAPLPGFSAHPDLIHLILRTPHNNLKSIALKST